MTASSLQRFGELIEQIAVHCDDPETRVYSFLSHVSLHSGNRVGIPPPQHLAERVKEVLAIAQLPVVAAEFFPLDEGPPCKAVLLPSPLIDAYLHQNKYERHDRIQVLRSDRRVVAAELVLSSGGEYYAIVPAELHMNPEEVVAIRKSPIRLLSWLPGPRWIAKADLS
ncbi:MAG: hypothetical protein U1A77_21685 [Pirellulales bacterium]